MPERNDDELTRRLKARIRKPAITQPEAVEETRPLLPVSEQSLGRLMERVEMLEARLNLTYKVVWRTSAAVLGLVGANFGWDWLGKLVKALSGGR